MTEPQPAESGVGPPSPAGGGNRFAGLGDRPVTEHVTAFESELDRLQRELGTIDEL